LRNQEWLSESAARESLEPKLTLVAFVERISIRLRHEHHAFGLKCTYEEPPGFWSGKPIENSAIQQSKSLAKKVFAFFAVKIDPMEDQDSKLCWYCGVNHTNRNVDRAITSKITHYEVWMECGIFRPSTPTVAQVRYVFGTSTIGVYR
jgi:hypothetical protein